MIFKGEGSLDAMVMGETQFVLNFSHVRIPCKTNQRQGRLQRRRQERQKQPKIAKDFKGDSSLDAIFPKLWEGLNVVWTFHMSGYLMKPIRNNEDSTTLRKMHKACFLN